MCSVFFYQIPPTLNASSSAQFSFYLLSIHIPSPHSKKAPRKKNVFCVVSCYLSLLLIFVPLLLRLVIMPAFSASPVSAYHTLLHRTNLPPSSQIGKKHVISTTQLFFTFFPFIQKIFFKYMCSRHAVIIIQVLVAHPPRDYQPSKKKYNQR